MVTLFVRHDVASFEKWKQAYDDFDAERAALGVKGAGVFQDNTNPNSVTVFHEFDDMQSAEDFVSNPRLMVVMKEGGVVGAPSLWFTTRV